MNNTSSLTTQERLLLALTDAVLALLSDAAKGNSTMPMSQINALCQRIFDVRGKAT